MIISISFMKLREIIRFNLDKQYHDYNDSISAKEGRGGGGACPKVCLKNRKGAKKE